MEWSGSYGTFIYIAWIRFTLGIIQELGGGIIGIIEGAYGHTNNEWSMLSILYVDIQRKEQSNDKN